MRSMKGSNSLPRLVSSRNSASTSSLAEHKVSSHHAMPPKRAGSQYFQKPFEVAYRQLAEQRNLRRLEALFIEADADGSGEMSLDEFRDALRKTHIQQSFSILGVQPHQAEVIFRSMDKEHKGELSIHAFMAGLEELVGSDLEGAPKELDVSTLRPSFKAKQKIMTLHSRDSSQWAEEIMKLKQAKVGMSAWSTLTPKEEKPTGSAYVDVSLSDLSVAEDQLHAAFAHTAAANALHPALLQRKSKGRRGF